MAWSNPPASVGSRSSRPASSARVRKSTEPEVPSSASAASGASGKPALASRSAQRLTQAPGAPEVHFGKRRLGRHKPVLGKPEAEASRIADLVGVRQDVQGVDEVADEFQVLWSRQAPVVSIGCHVYILSRPPDRPRCEGRR